MQTCQTLLTSTRVVILLTAILVFAGAAFATTEKMVYSFQGPPDGALPLASLVADAAGNFYGTTINGGSNWGTVFELSPPSTAGGIWTEQVLHAFQNDTVDGRYPTGTLVSDKQGNLYGTTQEGGPHNTGTIFELSPPASVGGNWSETILWSFPQSLLKGFAPAGKLSIDAAGNLYGTTSAGGTHVKTCTTCGVVFELVKPKTSGQVWAERVLYNFGSVANDGFAPGPDLLLRGGLLYGTTSGGGANNSGIIFQVSPHTGFWIETILHNFAHNDGTGPQGGLIADAAGNLFGTTTAGGPVAYCSCGTIYELSPPAVAGGEWQETTLYAFKGLSDGARPSGPLWRDSLGDLFGTATNRGVIKDGGAGTVFKLKAPAVSGGAWTFFLLHDFSGIGLGTGDGGVPQGGLILQNGLFYGTTQAGGADNLGTVFSVVP